MTIQSTMEQKQANAKSLRNSLALLAGAFALAAALSQPVNHLLTPSEDQRVGVEAQRIFRKNPEISAKELMDRSRKTALREIEKESAGNQILFTGSLSMAGVFLLLAFPAHLRARHWEKMLKNADNTGPGPS
jgi:hypothetical protein